MISYEILQESLGQRVYMNSNARATLGILIATWRLGAGLSQTDLAEALHTQQTTISKMEAGTYRLSALQLLEILDTCRLRLADVADDIEGAVYAKGRPLWERIDE